MPTFLKRLFFFRGCLSGFKLIVVLVMIGTLIGLLLLIGFLKDGLPGPFTVGLLALAVWVFFGTFLNHLQGDPYYAFELVPTLAVSLLTLGLVFLLLMENLPGEWGTLSSLMTAYAVVFAPGMIFRGLLVLFLASYCLGGAGSALALAFSSGRIDVQQWQQQTREEIGELGRAARGGSAPAAETPPDLDEGQIAARRFWQSQTGSNYIYCSSCGLRFSIWDPGDFCHGCGGRKGIPNFETGCIEQNCEARVARTDKFCFRCGAKQP